MTEAEKLAALDRAATWVGKKPLVLECVENGVWQIRLIFGEGEKNCTTMRQWADAYRANQLVLIGPDAVEKATDAIRNFDDPGAELADAYATAAIAALGVK